MMWRCLIRAWLAGFILWASYAQALWAHTSLVSAEPAPGARLPTAPQRIVLNFTETLAVTSTVALYRDNFQAVPNITVVRNPAQPQQLTALVPALARGLYTVQWTAIGDDGDKVSGSFTFQVKGAVAQGNRLRLIVIIIIIVSSGVMILLRNLQMKSLYKQQKVSHKNTKGTEFSFL